MLETLKQQFANVAGLTFEQRDALIMIGVKNAQGQAVFTTHGAHLLSFQPNQAGAKDCLWVSESAVYDGTKPIRGGIPICWPWFGAAPREGLPAHGFVRNRAWQLVDAETLAEASTRLRLETQSDDATLSMWPVPFKLSLTIEVGASLTLSLTSTNLSDHSQQLTEAFHSYFAISDTDAVSVSGLAGSECHDKLTHATVAVQSGDLKITPPIDSVFLNQQGELVIEDALWQRQLTLQNSGTSSAIVWNPGSELIKGFADMDNQAWPRMLCVEVGNVLQNAVTIPSQGTHTMTMVLKSR